MSVLGLAVLIALGDAAAGRVVFVGKGGCVNCHSIENRGGSVGPAVAGRAQVLDAAGTARVRQELKRKYGISARLTFAFSALRRGSTGTVGITVAPR